MQCKSWSRDHRGTENTQRKMPGLTWIFLSVPLWFSLTACMQQMADQPRYDPLQYSSFFPNGSSARPLPDGVIPHDYVTKDDLRDTGMIQGKPANRFPFPLDRDFLQRGRQRYDIYCSPCHGYLGNGDGMAARRGFDRKPASFQTDDMRAAPAGRFFDVITNGFGAMPTYANQIPVRDRWAITAYIRALQLSQSASITDVPPDKRRQLESEKEK
jgi:mono/diheme cytochrome c family protein